MVPRRKDVAKLMRDGTLIPESNMNFGEGGAGAYTDGKLSTRSTSSWPSTGDELPVSDR